MSTPVSNVLLNSPGDLPRTVPAIPLSQVHRSDGQRRKTPPELHSEHRHTGAGGRHPKDNPVPWSVPLVSLFSPVGILTGACDRVISVGMKLSFLEFLSLANKC